MAYCAIQPHSLTPTVAELAKLVHSETSDCFDSYHFAFNGAPDAASIYCRRILLEPDKRTNNQEVKKKMTILVQQRRAIPVWSVVLKFVPENWKAFHTYAETRELLFDLMYYDSKSGTFENRSLFKCWLTQDAEKQPRDYALDKSCFLGDSRIHFKKGAIRVVKKEKQVVVVIRLVEAGFYDISPLMGP